MENKINNISEEIKEKGVVAIDNFLENEDLKNILKIVKEPKKGSTESYYPVYLSQYISKLLKFDFKKVNNSLFFKKIAKKLNFKKISESVFDAKAELQMIDCYHNKQSNDQILSWHNDIGIKDSKNINSLKNFYEATKATFSTNQTGSARGIKFFIYLTDVKSDNGSLAVIPYSDKIVKSICSLITKKKIEPISFWSLKNLRNLVSQKTVQDLLCEDIQKEVIDNFLKNTKFIEDEDADTTQFDYQMNKGGAVIFDELSVHRGSAPKKTDRIVLRFVYKKINILN